MSALASQNETLELIQVTLAGDADYIIVLVNIEHLETKIVLQGQTLLELEDILRVLGKLSKLNEVRHSLRLALERDLHSVITRILGDLFFEQQSVVSSRALSVAAVFVCMLVFSRDPLLDQAKRASQI